MKNDKNDNANYAPVSYSALPIGSVAIFKEIFDLSVRKD